MKRSIVLTALILGLGFLIFSCEKKSKEASKSEEIEKKEVSKSAPFKLSDYLKSSRVDFKKLKSQGVESFNARIDQIASYDLMGLKSLNDKKAFWINTYNLFVTKILLENYPQGNDMFKIEGFFDKYYIDVGGNSVNLNDISSRILKFSDEYKDPRINFALSNGTKSSPELKDGEYTGAKLGEELDLATKSFVYDEKNVSVGRELTRVEDKEVYVLGLSKVFDWFEDDFKKSGGVEEFLIKYLKKEDSDFLKLNKGKIRIEYLPYDYEFAGFGE